MRSLLVIHNRAAEPERQAVSASPKPAPPETLLRAYGYAVARATDEAEAAKRIAEADAAILHIPVSDIPAWASLLLKRKIVPLLWWCSEATAASSLEACEDNVPIDGVLTASMKERELHWALHFGAKQCFERQQWHNERAQLLSRIEERKWIDMAKGILCDMKRITESEAYDILRKQAMNERKRIVDVAASIVKVYQLLQEQKQKGAKR
ncbi:ANTAR domain-containing response regulator [Paenibacillus flagellatus]|uniref:ANTAR domain-containing protein n=1 Tax=Paenibacillus flagellatus TaxID=2211139 RepID=A0A2V5KFM6_9BACL|nr:ANTAR domain-containing protein [Paenibacillus flagellatus]PYI52890.1 hypothetical protein DLM86_17945 [Paenibacillus flagellatus]